MTDKTINMKLIEYIKLTLNVNKGYNAIIYLCSVLVTPHTSKFFDLSFLHVILQSTRAGSKCLQYWIHGNYVLFQN